MERGRDRVSPRGGRTISISKTFDEKLNLARSAFAKMVALPVAWMYLKPSVVLSRGERQIVSRLEVRRC